MVAVCVGCGLGLDDVGRLELKQYAICGQSVEQNYAQGPRAFTTGESSQTPAPFTNIANPSDCLPMLVQLDFWAQAAVFNRSETDWFEVEFSILADTGSGLSTLVSGLFATVPIWSAAAGPADMVQSVGDSRKVCVTIDPGDSIAVRSQTAFTVRNGSDIAEVNAFSQVRWFGANTHP